METNQYLLTKEGEKEESLTGATETDGERDARLVCTTSYILL